MTWLYVLAGLGIFWTILCWALLIPVFLLYMGVRIKKADERDNLLDDFEKALKEREKRLAEIEAKVEKQDVLFDDFERALLDERQRLKEIREMRLRKKIEEKENDGSGD